MNIFAMPRTIIQLPRSGTSRVNIVQCHSFSLSALTDLRAHVQRSIANRKVHFCFRTFAIEATIHLTTLVSILPPIHYLIVNPTNRIRQVFPK